MEAEITSDDIKESDMKKETTDACAKMDYIMFATDLILTIVCKQWPLTKFDAIAREYTLLENDDQVYQMCYGWHDLYLNEMDRINDKMENICKKRNINLRRDNPDHVISQLTLAVELIKEYDNMMTLFQFISSDNVIRQHMGCLTDWFDGADRNEILPQRDQMVCILEFLSKQRDFFPNVPITLKHIQILRHTLIMAKNKVNTRTGSWCTELKNIWATVNKWHSHIHENDCNSFMTVDWYYWLLSTDIPTRDFTLLYYHDEYDASDIRDKKCKEQCCVFRQYSFLSGSEPTVNDFQRFFEENVACYYEDGVPCRWTKVQRLLSTENITPIQLVEMFEDLSMAGWNGLSLLIYSKSLFQYVINDNKSEEKLKRQLADTWKNEHSGCICNCSKYCKPDTFAVDVDMFHKLKEYTKKQNLKALKTEYDALHAALHPFQYLQYLQLCKYAYTQDKYSFDLLVQKHWSFMPHVVQLCNAFWTNTIRLAKLSISTNNSNYLHYNRRRKCNQHKKSKSKNGIRELWDSIHEIFVDFGSTRISFHQLLLKFKNVKSRAATKNKGNKNKQLKRMQRLLSKFHHNFHTIFILYHISSRKGTTPIDDLTSAVDCAYIDCQCAKKW